jgi:hypothetical protein
MSDEIFTRKLVCNWNCRAPKSSLTRCKKSMKTSAASGEFYNILLS